MHFKVLLYAKLITARFLEKTFLDSNHLLEALYTFSKVDKYIECDFFVGLGGIVDLQN